ncbi:hypothetical protein FDP41_006935 [Naegleria fowleri]|uniref:Uncharacterized protein n=1 Tax=Naegleria fowleri TaxID=5763 RepID=A0A6A5BL23_NAEFO|nr:uncharacterized protein FDP41_006935 [Naegleria fowleri]KAF0974325.1 hypothetical protein FDP41_006935 [Naegleria fowleri]
MTITILNHQNESILGYSLVRLVGKVSGSHSTLTVLQQPGNKKTEWEIKGGYFKALILLRDGRNQLHLSTSSSQLHWTLTYDSTLINTTEYESRNIQRLRPVYIYCKDHDGSFNSMKESQGSNDLSAAIRKMQVCALLMQTFCAEALKNDKTFALEVEKNDSSLPHVSVLQLKKWTREELASLGNNWEQDGGCDGYNALHSELNEFDGNNSSVVYFAVLGGSFYDPVTKKTRMATALGGGKLGLFADVAMHTYPSRVDEIVSCWQDSRLIDERQVRDDSCFRKSFWANFATCLGASMHEIGHCFGCPHTPGGIMSRGFDNFNRFFVISEPGDDQPTFGSASSEKGAYWEDSSIEIIMNHPAFAGVSKCIKKRKEIGRSCSNPSDAKSTTRSSSSSSSHGQGSSSSIHEDTSSMIDAHYYVIGPDVIHQSSFENVKGKEWLERHGERPFATFIEQSRNEKEILLFDSGRNMLLMLTKSQVQWKMNDTKVTTWYFLGHGYPLFLSNPDHKKIIDAHCCVIRKD